MDRRAALAAVLCAFVIGFPAIGVEQLQAAIVLPAKAL